METIVLRASVLTVSWSAYIVGRVTLEGRRRLAITLVMGYSKV